MDALASARSALPAWTGFAGLVYWPVAVFLVSLLAAWLISSLGLRPLRRSERQGTDLHWTEQARVSYPLRVALGTGFFVSLILPLVLSDFFRNPFALAPRALIVLAALAAAWAGFTFGTRGAWSLVQRRRVPVREQVRSGVVVTFLYLPVLLLFAAVAGLMPQRMDGRAWGLLGLGAAAMALVLWRSGVPVLRLLRLARPASERLQRIVDQAAEKTGSRPAAVWEVDWPAANAIALVYRRAIVFSTGVLRLLTDEELATVAAHELAHLSEPWRVKALRSLSAWVLLGLATAAPVFRTWGWAGLGVLYFVFLAVVFGLRKMARRMEVRADAIGRGQEGEAGIYARALEKIYEHNLVPAVMAGRLKVHPSLWDRMTAAGLQPAYPRPEPPSRLRALALYLLVMVLFIIGWVAADQIVPRLLLPNLLPEDQALAFQIGLDGNVRALHRLAWLRASQSRMEESSALWGAVLALDPEYAARNE